MRSPLVILLAAFAVTAIKAEAAPQASGAPKGTATAVKKAVAATTAPKVPTTMQHLTVQVVEPKMPADSALSLPVEYWIAGTTYLHRTEGLDKKHNKQRESVVVSPDYWQYDDVSKTGQHIHEKQAKPVRLSIFNSTFKDAVSGLNFGNELAWFQAKAKEQATKAAKPDQKKVSADADLTDSTTKTMTVLQKKDENGTQITEYRLPFDTKVVVFAVDAKTNKPLWISMRSIKSGKGVKMQYLTYETLPFNATAFKPAPNVKVQNFDGDTWRKKQDENRQELSEIEAKTASYRKQLIEKMIAERKNTFK